MVLALVTGACAIRFGLTFPWARTSDALAGSDWLLLAAASAANIVSIAAKAAAWYLLLRRSTPLRLATAQAATFVGVAVGSISVSVSGEATRAQFASTKGGLSFGTVVASLVMTRIVEAIGLIVFLSVTFIILPPWPSARLLGVALSIAAGILALGYRVAPWSRLRSHALGRRHEMFVRMVTSIGRGSLAGAVLLTALNWLAQWTTYHWSIAATHTPVTPAVSLSALVIANLAGILRLTPGNIGVMQGSLILGMHAFDIPAANALAAGLALQAVEVLPVLTLGIVIAGKQGFRRLATAAVSTSSTN